MNDWFFIIAAVLILNGAGWLAWIDFKARTPDLLPPPDKSARREAYLMPPDRAPLP